MIADAARPRLRADLTLIDQEFRGERALIVKDRIGGKYFRFRPAEATVMRALDGTRSAAQVAEALAEQGLRVTGAVVERFAAKLSSLGLMERTMAERSVLELERLRAERRRRRSPFRGELLRLRWSLGDPDAWLTRTMPRLRWCFSPAFAAVSGVLFAAYFAIVAYRWDDFGREVAARFAPSALTPGAAAVFVGTAFVVIAIHELGHAFACKRFGGEVHEIGMMLMFFMPAFFCNVDDAWSFPELRARLWVTAAGLWIQLVLAALAALAWCVAAPGTLAADVALSAMIVGGLTTVVANLNPLLPLDGYFALSDYLGIPNLRGRALAHTGWWFRSRVLQLPQPEPAAADDRERRILLLYGVGGLVYGAASLALVAGWAFGWARDRMGAVGGALVLLAVAALLRGPVRPWRVAIGQAVRARWRARVRWRDPRVAGVALLLLTLLALATPWPLTTSGALVAAPALVLPVTAPNAGIVVEVLVREGERVAAGRPLVRLGDPALDREGAARTREVDSLWALEGAAAAAGADGTLARLSAARAAAASRLAGVRTRQAALTVRARTAGEVATPHPEALTGRRVAAGAPLLSLVDPDSIEVRVAFGAAGAAYVRAGLPLRLVSYADVARPIQTAVQSVAPAAGDAGTRGGVEARVRLAADDAWRPGVQGEGRVRFGRTNALGAFWWAVRTRVRGDLLL